MNSSTKLFLFGLTVVIFITFSKIIPHPWNFSPIVGLILFSAYVFENKYNKIIIPIFAILISDIILNFQFGSVFHSGSFIIYLTYVLISLIAYIALKKTNLYKVIGASLGASMVFFLITNFVLFYPESPIIDISKGAYPHNFTGVIASYVAGLPFFKNAIVGDLLFSLVLFGMYSIYKNFVIRSSNSAA